MRLLETLRVAGAMVSVVALAACSDPGGSGTPIGGGGGTGGAGATGGISWGNGGEGGTGGTGATSGGAGGETGGTGGEPAPACEQDSDCPPEMPHCSSVGECFECLTDDECGAEGICLDGACQPASCTPEEKKCAGETALVCKATGDGWHSFECAPGICKNGDCTVCDPGAVQCQGFDVVECSESGGSWNTVQTCETGQICVYGECRDCAPGALQCNGTAIEQCNDEGVFVLKEDCADQGLGCALGKCWDPCLSNLKDSNAGCDYWAADLDQIADAANGTFAIVVANFADSVATVTVTSKDSEGGAETEVAQQDVAAGGLQIFELPQRNIDAPGVSWRAYRVRATGPIVAYQFNPLDNEGVFSNDASLLLPANTFGTEYLAVSRFQITGSDSTGPSPWQGFITVMASSPDTTVTIQPTVATEAGGGLPSIPAGGSHSIMIQPYQVLNIKSNAEGADLTGSVITSDKPVAVFSGHEAAIGAEQCCADHLEQQMFPVSTWGKTYVAAKSFPRGDEQDYWRVLAAEDNTVVTFQPAVQLPTTLNRGEWFEFQTDQSFSVQSEKPILLSQVLPASDETVVPPPGELCFSASECAPGYDCFITCEAPACTTQGDDPACPANHTCQCQGILCGCRPIGDPALILSVPVEQYRDEYIFLTPNAYAKDYVNIIAPTGTEVTLDGTLVPLGQFTAVPGGTGWSVAQLLVADGVHTLTASAPVGLIAYGYDADVSYGYTAGLNLEKQQ